MRFGVCLPQAGRYVDAEVQRRLAREIEAMGYESLWVSDHVIVPRGESYVPEVMHEPLALLAWLAAETATMRLGVSVLVVPYRDPVFTAKFLSSIDVLSGGRIVLGVGAGWLKSEFEALSAPFDDRGAVTDEYLRVIRNLWETDTSSFSGRWKQYEDMRMFPKHHRSRDRPVPIVVGGNTARSLRRAAELGDGWHPISLTPEAVVAGVAAYRDACARAGRAVGPVVLRHMPDPGAPPLSVDDVRAYAAAGVDELLYSYVAPTPDDLLRLLDLCPRQLG